MGVPADLLVRRPDVKASLYQLRSALASKDATYASYFPSLSLTGGVGESTSELKELLRNPVGSLGAGLVLPFCSGIKCKLIMTLPISIIKPQW